MMSILNISAYRFISLTDLTEWQAQFRQFCQQRSLKGSIVLSAEGVNLMLAGVRPVVEEFKQFLAGFSPFADMDYNESVSSVVPFKRLFVKIKKHLTPLNAVVEIVSGEGSYLPPLRLKQWLDDKKAFILLDFRNKY